MKVIEDIMREADLEVMRRAPQAQRKYSKITETLRTRFLTKIFQENKSIKKAAEELNINYSSAKTILTMHRKKSKYEPLLSEADISLVLKNTDSSSDFAATAASLVRMLPPKHLVRQSFLSTASNLSEHHKEDSYEEHQPLHFSRPYKLSQQSKDQLQGQSALSSPPPTPSPKALSTATVIKQSVSSNNLANNNSVVKATPGNTSTGILKAAPSVEMMQIEQAQQSSSSPLYQPQQQQLVPPLPRMSTAPLFASAPDLTAISSVANNLSTTPISLQPKMQSLEDLLFPSLLNNNSLPQLNANSLPQSMLLQQLQQQLQNQQQQQQQQQQLQNTLNQLILIQNALLAQNVAATAVATPLVQPSQQSSSPITQMLMQQQQLLNLTTNNVAQASPQLPKWL